MDQVTDLDPNVEDAYTRLESSTDAARILRDHCVRARMEIGLLLKKAKPDEINWSWDLKNPAEKEPLSVVRLCSAIAHFTEFLDVRYNNLEAELRPQRRAHLQEDRMKRRRSMERTTRYNQREQIRRTANRTPRGNPMAVAAMGMLPPRPDGVNHSQRFSANLPVPRKVVEPVPELLVPPCKEFK